MAYKTSVAVGLSDTIRAGCRSMTTCLPSGAVIVAGKDGWGAGGGAAGCSLVAQATCVNTKSNETNSVNRRRPDVIASTLPGALSCFAVTRTSVMLSLTNQVAGVWRG
jgi:hypothetical protein